MLRLLASGLTPAERLAATSAVDAELVEFSSARRALLVADGDEDLLPVLMEALDSASDTPLPATPVFVAAVPAAHTAADPKTPELLGTRTTSTRMRGMILASLAQERQWHSPPRKRFA